MRISANPQSPYYDSAYVGIVGVRVFLDDTHQENVFEVNEEGGWVERHVTNADGRNLDGLTERVFGVVRVER